MKSQKIRYTVQILFLILVIIFAVNHQLAERGIKFLPSNANLHSLCPMGGVETLYTMVTQDTLVKKVHNSAIVLMWGALLLALLLGAVFCGWLCPFGTVQEFFGWIGKKLFGKRYNHFLSDGARKYLQFLRYVVLAIILYQTAQTGKLFFETWDPYHTLFAIVSDEISLLAYGILAVVLLAAMVEDRAWCKFVCPMGAINGIFNKFSIFKIHRNKSQCIDCGACDHACPMNISVQDKDKVTSTLCTRCGKCVTACPAQMNTLEYQLGKFCEVSK